MTVVIVDQKSKVAISNILWSTFTWTATVALYDQLQYKANGALQASSSSMVIVNPTDSTITVTDLAINDTGMYIIQVNVTSTNYLHRLICTSNAILVKLNTSNYENFSKSKKLNNFVIYLS